MGGITSLVIRTVHGYLVTIRAGERGGTKNTLREIIRIHHLKDRAPDSTHLQINCCSIRLYVSLQISVKLSGKHLWKCSFTRRSKSSHFPWMLSIFIYWVDFVTKKVRPPVGRAKKHACFHLRDFGHTGKLWQHESHVLPIKDRQHQINVYGYIINHKNKGAWTWTYHQGIYWSPTIKL